MKKTYVHSSISIHDSTVLNHSPGGCIGEKGLMSTKELLIVIGTYCQNKPTITSQARF